MGECAPPAPMPSAGRRDWIEFACRRDLSALQLRQPNLVEVVTAVLRDTGLEANLLDLEVTEASV